MKTITGQIFTLLVLLLPAFAAAGTLDDYYLARLAPGYAGAGSAATGVVAKNAVPFADRSLTMVRHAAVRDWAQLEPATQKVLAKVMAAPPVLAGERVCVPVNGHFTIHYATTGADKPNLTDANGNNVPDWVETVAGVFEYVYSVEVTKMGYQPPPGTTYHVYLQSLASQSAYGFTSDYYSPSFPPLPVKSVPTYITIDNGFTDPVYGSFTPLQSLRVTAAHEFHHAIQFGYNYYFDPYYAEMTSTWMEDEVYDSVNQLYSYLVSYLPDTNTIALNQPLNNDLSPYGRWIFNRYLAELHGSRTVVRSFWEQLGTVAAPSNHSDIAALPVLDQVLNQNLGNNFFGFAKKIFLKDWSSHVGEVSLIPSVSVPQVRTFTAHGSIVAPINVLTTPYTFAYYKYLPSSADGQDLTLTFPGLSSSLAVTAFKVSTLGTQEIPYNAGTQSIVVPAFTSDATVYLLVCNNGNGNMQAPVALTFPADGATTLDGSLLDANALAIPAQDPIPVTPAATSGGGGGGCFIATAAYGSYLHPKVALLREFRDHYLLTNAPGRLFVACYYKVSPPIANFIARHETLRLITRLLLTPIVFAVEHGMLTLALLIGCLAAFVAQQLRLLRRQASES
ncbi:MXAN_6640 family putative metalloprotease [Geomonas limicola]|uniref:MXAN_6640 family putative metalloprotease n=1 Tax=Geomonas limicola TaxID=2740186 RepID=UPI0016136B54|nr:MXAN_6640 family putative metalloprotease [Geomonas limicola]